jgi:hypothetical protein
VWSTVFPYMSHITTSHLQQLPVALAEDYPHAQAIALAGRLPGLMKAAGRGVVCACATGTNPHCKGQLLIRHSCLQAHC